MAKPRSTSRKTAYSVQSEVVKILTVSVTYNADGRSVLTRTMATADGKQHTFNWYLSPLRVEEFLRFEKDLRDSISKEADAWSQVADLASP